MSEHSFEEIGIPTMAYDPDKDGVWLGDSTGPIVFLPRNTVIEVVVALAGEGKTE